MPVVLRTNVPYPPIFAGRPATTVADPHGFLPLNRTIRSHGRVLVLQWDVGKKQLVPFWWPTIDGRRIPPSEFAMLRQTHQFRGPCCLCATLTNEYTEAAVFMVTSGRLAGEYVAACARGKCKYWIFLERLYNRIGLPIRTYPTRDANSTPIAAIEYNPDTTAENDENSDPFASSNPSSPVRTPVRRENHIAPVTPSTGSTSSTTEVRRVLQPSNRPEKRARVAVNASQIPTANPRPARVPTTPFGLLMQMDSPRPGGGITVEQFNGLFTKCASCNIITTTGVFRNHCCVRRSNRRCPIPPNTEIIDLTLDDSDSD